MYKKTIDDVEFLTCLVTDSNGQLALAVKKKKKTTHFKVHPVLTEFSCGTCCPATLKGEVVTLSSACGHP